MFKRKDQIVEETTAVEDLEYIDVKQIPSNFLSYPDDLKISYKTYRWGAIKTASKTKYDEKTSFPLISSGIRISSELEPEFSIDNLTLSDFLYIGLLRKLSTFKTEKFQLATQCTKCGKTITKEIPWNGLEFDELEIPKLPVMFRLSDGKLLKFNPLTIGQYLELIEKDQEDDEIRAMWISLTDKNAITYEELYDLPLDDGAVIDEINEILYHGLKDVKIECNNCKYINRVSVDGKEALLRPFRETKKVKTNRIEFGDKSTH